MPADREVTLNGSRASGTDESVRFELGQILEPIRRRWPIVLVPGLVAVVGVWWQQKQTFVPSYTAEATFSISGERRPLTLGGLEFVPGIGQTASATEIELLRSHRILGAIVDSTGLRLSLQGETVAPREVFSAVTILPTTPAGSFQLVRAGERIALSDATTGRVISQAAPGEWLEGSGLRLRLADTVRFSGPVVLSIADHLDAVESLRANLQIENIGGTSFIRVRYTSRDPVLAAAVANAVAVAYQEYDSQRLSAAAERRNSFILSQLPRLTDSLEAAQRALQEHQQVTAILDPEGQGMAIVNSLMATEREIRTLDSRQMLLRSLLESVRLDPSTAATRRLVVIGGDVIPGAAAAYERLRMLESERTRLTASRYGYADYGPGVEAVDSLIVATKNELIAFTEFALRPLQSQREDAVLRLGTIREQLYSMPEQIYEFAALRRRVAAMENIFDNLVGRYYEWQITDWSGPVSSDVISPALVPRRPDPPRGQLNLMFAFMLGLAIGAGLALLIEYADTTVQNARDAERAVGLEVIGSIPNLARSGNGVQPPVPLAAGEATPGGEAFRMLRTALRFARAKRPKAIAVVSPVGSEGKTTLAVNLACALAHQGNRVLLLDADLRRPKVHATFGVSRSPGLSDVLIGDAPASEATLASSVPRLSILPCGTAVPNPAELLGSEAFAQLVGNAQKHFDAVVVDAPPVLAVADATVISALMDGVLVVVQVKHTERTALLRAINQLRQAQVPLLGLVMNRVRPDGRAGGYEYYYHYVDSA